MKKILGLATNAICTVQGTVQAYGCTVETYGGYSTVPAPTALYMGAWKLYVYKYR